jgi:uncharacterized membrane protein
MSSVNKAIDIDVPVQVAYNQWTQFEQFPQFMEGVKQVRQLDDQRLHWIAEVGGKTQEWDAKITEQIPNQRIPWTSISGAPNGGAVDFHRLSDHQTRLTLTLEYDPQGFIENVGDALGFMTRRIEGDLKRFKEFIETRGSETGAWRGEITNWGMPDQADTSHND